MSNVCECKEKIEFELIDGQPTLIEILTKMNRLKLENECLKADNRELHNIINGNNKYTTMVDGSDDLSYMDEYAKGNEELEIELAKMYEVTSDDYKFGGHDLKQL